MQNKKPHTFCLSCGSPDWIREYVYMLRKLHTQAGALNPISSFCSNKLDLPPVTITVIIIHYPYNTRTFGQMRLMPSWAFILIVIYLEWRQCFCKQTNKTCHLVCLKIKCIKIHLKKVLKKSVQLGLGKWLGSRKPCLTSIKREDKDQSSTPGTLGNLTLLWWYPTVIPVLQNGDWGFLEQAG